MEHPPTDPLDDDDETLLGDADELDDPSLELDDQLDSELDDDEDI